MEHSEEIAAVVERIATPIPFELERQRIPVDIAGIINPYKNYPNFSKVQVHCHSKWSDGHLDAKRVMQKYRDKGYDFVCLTDHDTQTHEIGLPFTDKHIQWETSRSCNDIFKDPGVQGITWIPGLEPYGEYHLLWLGLTRKHPCKPQEGESLAGTIQWIEQQEGIAVAAHPLAGTHAWPEVALLNIMGLRGVEFETSTVAQWDRLLQADKARWGFCSDDSDTKERIDQRGWVIVNWSQAKPGGRHVIEEMRNGNFYSVRRGSMDSQIYPHFQEIKAEFGTIIVTYDGASEVRFISRDGLLPYNVVGTNKASFKCSGSEGYVRIELQNPQGTVAYSQPLFVYGASVESCIQVDSTQLQVKFIHHPHSGKFWYLAHGSDCIWGFYSDEQGARDALSVLQHYQPDRICFVGRNSGKLNANLLYFTVDDAPVGRLPNQSYVPFDPSKLYVEFGSDNRWKIINPLPPVGKEWLLDFEDSEIQAHRALEFIQRYNFNAFCFVGSVPRYRMTYFIDYTKAIRSKTPDWLLLSTSMRIK